MSSARRGFGQHSPGKLVGAMRRPVLVLYRPPQKNPQTEWSGDRGGAFSTALEPLCRHLVAAFGTLQAKKRRDISAFQPLLMGFFELILMQGNSFCEEPVFFGSVWIIHMEAFTNSVKLVE